MEAAGLVFLKLPLWGAPPPQPKTILPPRCVSTVARAPVLSTVAHALVLLQVQAPGPSARPSRLPLPVLFLITLIPLKERLSQYDLHGHNQQADDNHVWGCLSQASFSQLFPVHLPEYRPLEAICFSFCLQVQFTTVFSQISQRLSFC